MLSITHEDSFTFIDTFIVYHTSIVVTSVQYDEWFILFWYILSANIGELGNKLVRRHIKVIVLTSDMLKSCPFTY